MCCKIKLRFGNKLPSQCFEIKTDIFCRAQIFSIGEISQTNVF